MKKFKIVSEVIEKYTIRERHNVSLKRDHFLKLEREFRKSFIFARIFQPIHIEIQVQLVSDIFQ